MVVVKLSGGLGNQMLQYSFALFLKHLGKEVELDLSLYQYINEHNGPEILSLFPIEQSVELSRSLASFHTRERRLRRYTDLAQYKVLRTAMRVHFAQIYKFLLTFPMEGTCKNTVQQMAYYQSKESLSAFFQLICLCVRLRDRIFYVPEHNMVVSLLRAILFPITCSDYFRYLIKK